MNPREVLVDLAYLAGAILLAALVVSGVALIVLHVPEPASITIGLFLTISGAITLLLGGGLLWLVASPVQFGLRARLTIALAAGGVVALLNVVVTAWLMFISAHDLALLMLLLLFSLLVSLSFAAVITRAVMAPVGVVTAAAGRLAAGDLSARVSESGHGELADLARNFNRMAERVEGAFRHERELEAARRTLVAGVSHDLRSPLASIRAAVEALHDGVVSDPETVQRYLGGVVQDVTRLSQLIDDLFELARLDAGMITLQREPTALGDLISDTLEGLQARAHQQGVTVQGAIDGTPVAVLDAARIQRVLDNLLDNALRHTPPGGSVEITARETPGGVQLHVWNSGEGIAEQDLPFIFDRFYRGDPARGRAGGAGLGLAIARGFVEAHGGTICASSAPGAGALFTVTLPHRTGASTHEAVLRAASPDAAAGERSAAPARSRGAG